MSNLRHIGIFVKDLERMADFYQKLLDMEIIYDEIEQGDYLRTLLQIPNEVLFHIIKMKNKNSLVIELLQYVSSKCHEKEVTNIGLSHLAITIDNLDEIYIKLKNDGIGFNTPPMTSPYGNVKLCFCKDPEGNFLELVEDIKN